MSTFDDASLVFIPSGYKTSKAYSVKPSDGSGDLTFSRSNDTASRVNSAGLIEKVRTNLALYSEDLTNAVWTKEAVTISANATNSPVNSLTADKVIASASAGDKYAAEVLNVTNGVAYTTSGYFKAAEYTYAFMRLGGTSGNPYVIYNLATQAVVSTFGLTTSTITSVGNGWYRVTATATQTSTTLAPVLMVIPSTGYTLGGDNIVEFTGNGTSGGFIWGLQVETGDIATDYIATTSAAVSVGPVANVPRLDYLNSSCPRLLLEPQRTNLATYSEQFDNSAWTKYGGATVTANTVTSPDGYTNADTLNTASGQEIYATMGSKAASAITYTFSCFAKYNSAAVFQISASDFVTSATIGNFNLQTGVATFSQGATWSGTSVKMENYGNGWYRCIMTSTSPTTTGLYVSLLTSTSGSAYIYGVQTEQAAYATSYIPTLGAAVTRGADACSKTGISSLIGQTEGTIFAEINFDLGVTAQGDSRIQLSDGTTSNWIFMGLPDGASSNLIRMYVNAPSGSVSAYSSSPIVNGVNKIAFGYKSGSFVLYVNGVQAATSSTTLTMATCSRIDLQGSVPAASTSERENIKQVLLFKTRLTNAQLAELTTL